VQRLAVIGLHGRLVPEDVQQVPEAVGSEFGGAGVAVQVTELIAGLAEGRCGERSHHDGFFAVGFQEQAEAFGRAGLERVVGSRPDGGAVKPGVYVVVARVGVCLDGEGLRFDPQVAGTSGLDGAGPFC
jgi:hypothetical protein